MKQINDDILESKRYKTFAMCYEENEDVDILLRSRGYPGWSDNNCRNLLIDFISVNCSLSRTKGFAEINVGNIKLVERLKHEGKFFKPTHFPFLWGGNKLQFI